MLYDDYGDEKFYTRDAAQAAGHNTNRGFYTNNKNIVELKRWMFKNWSFNGLRANGPLKTKDIWFFEFYAPWSVMIHTPIIGPNPKIDTPSCPPMEIPVRKNNVGPCL